MNNNADPTRPIPPAFVKQIPPMEVVKKKRKPEHTGGLMSHPILFARMGGKGGV